MIGELRRRRWDTRRDTGVPLAGQIAGAMPSQAGQMWAQQVAALTPTLTAPGPTTEQALTSETKSFADDFTAQIKKGGMRGIELVQTDNARLLEASREAAAYAGYDETQIKDLEAAGLAFVDVSSSGDKAAISLGGVVKALDAVAKSTLTPTFQQFMGAQERRLQVQYAGVEIQRQRQKEIEIPVQTAMQYAANPLLPVGTQTFGLGIGRGEGQASPKAFKGLMAPDMAGAYGPAGPMAVDQKSIESTSRYTATVQEATRAVEQLIATGYQKMADLGVDESAISSMKNYSTQIAAIQSEIASKQAALATIQYNHQLMLAKRNLADAAAMVGKQGAGHQGLIGALERENQLLSRQSQKLAIMLQQRQIMTQLALARFQAPGETGEERWARRQEQEIAAGIAQQQLDIQKKQFNVGIQIWDENARRQYIDAKYALADLQASRRISLEISYKQEELARVQAGLAATMANINADYQTGLEKVNIGIQNGMDAYLAGIGDNLEEMLEQGSKAANVFWANMRQQVKTFYEWLGEGITSTATGQGGGGAPGTRGATAAGMVGTFSSPTRATFGEAGSETVAILRNTRSMTISPQGGGGGSTFNMSLNYNGSGSQQDAAAFADAVARQVEQILNRKANLLGLRGPAY
jgi:hypothetical protein